MKRVIYDIGTNNGDNIPYYLKKADLVVAVEANPGLCGYIRQRFLPQIEQGRLVIENCVVTSEDRGRKVPFYVHRDVDKWSQFPRPRHNRANFKKVFLPAKPIKTLVDEHGFPYYLKIDVENYDHVLLRSLFANGVIPTYLSAESHCIEVFILMSCYAGYNLFQLVNGSTVASQYRSCRIKTVSGEEDYSFPYHSAGPFGEDLDGSWIDSESLFRKLQIEGLGWKDIHANKTSSRSLQSEAMRPLWIRSMHYRLMWIPAQISFSRERIYRGIKRRLLK